MMFGAPLAPMVFPATDRPSARFLAQFERALGNVADDALPSPLGIVLGGCAEAAFADCLASIGPVSRYVVVAIGDHHALIAVPDAVLHAIVEHAYGGDGSEAAPATTAPTRLAARLGYRIATLFAEAIAPALPGTDVAVCGATDMPADAVALTGPALGCGFEVTARGHTLGAIGLCVPLPALAYIERSAGGAIRDDGWEARLGAAMGAARVNVRCVLARPTLSAGEVARLVPGSVIPIPRLDEVALIANGYRIATGNADARDGRAAITINRTEFQA